MNVTQFGRSATIHQFPKGGRGGSRPAPKASSAVLRPARFMPTIVAESGWYHDETMREEQHSAEGQKPN